MKEKSLAHPFLQVYHESLVQNPQRSSLKYIYFMVLLFEGYLAKIKNKRIHNPDLEKSTYVSRPCMQLAINRLITIDRTDYSLPRSEPLGREKSNIFLGRSLFAYTF